MNQKLTVNFPVHSREFVCNTDLTLSYLLENKFRLRVGVMIIFISPQSASEKL